MMELTLPDLDALQEMDSLLILNLYSLELRHLHLIPMEERPTFYERARQGEQEARLRLLLHCLPFLLAKAFQVYEERQPIHIAPLDLVGEANLILLEKLNLALTKREPIPYLLILATRHMERYCHYQDPLIQRPFGLNNQVLARRQQYSSVESLDAPIPTSDGQMVLRDQMAAPAPDGMRGKEEHAFLARFAPLYEAVQHLAPCYQRTITRIYGLGDTPASTAPELSKEWHVRAETVRANKRKGLQNLRVLLADALEEMLSQQEPG